MKINNITVRLLLIVLNDGKKEILCTNLMDAEKYTIDCLKQLYHLKRRGIKKGYKFV